MTEENTPSDENEARENPATAAGNWEDSGEHERYTGGDGPSPESCSYPAFVVGITYPREAPQQASGRLTAGRLLRPVVKLQIDCGSAAEGPRLEMLRIPMSSGICAALADRGLRTGEALELVLRVAR